MGFNAKYHAEKPVPEPDKKFVEPNLYRDAVRLIEGKALKTISTGKIAEALGCNRNEGSKIIQFMREDRPDLIRFENNRYYYR
jgi:hypothetical protein